MSAGLFGAAGELVDTVDGLELEAGFWLGADALFCPAG